MLFYYYMIKFYCCHHKLFKIWEKKKREMKNKRSHGGRRWEEREVELQKWRVGGKSKRHVWPDLGPQPQQWVDSAVSQKCQLCKFILINKQRHLSREQCWCPINTPHPIPPFTPTTQKIIINKNKNKKEKPIWPPTLQTYNGLAMILTLKGQMGFRIFFFFFFTT